MPIAIDVGKRGSRPGRQTRKPGAAEFFARATPESLGKVDFPAGQMFPRPAESTIPELAAPATSPGSGTTSGPALEWGPDGVHARKKTGRRLQGHRRFGTSQTAARASVAPSA